MIILEGAMFELFGRVSLEFFACELDENSSLNLFARRTPKMSEILESCKNTELSISHNSFHKIGITVILSGLKGKMYELSADMKIKNEILLLKEKKDTE